MDEKGLNNVSNHVKNAMQKANVLITKTPAVQQLVLGSVSGWCTGFLSTKVGKTVALSIGGSILVIAAANQAGLVNVNWEKFGQKFGDKTSQVESKLCQNAPHIKANLGKFARTNTLFAAGFVGGFLLGLAS